MHDNGQVEVRLAGSVTRAVCCAAASEGVDSINHPDVGQAIRRYIESKSRHDVVPLDSPKAQQALWVAAAQIWEAASGKAISAEILKTLADRSASI